MKLIVNQSKIIEEPSKVQIRNYFGDLLKNSRSKIVLKKSASERLVFRWERFIGITVQFFSYDDKPEQKDSVNFLSCNNAINAAILFSNGNDSWRDILKMKEADDFNFKLFTRNIFKVIAIVSFVGSLLAVAISFLSSVDSSGTIANFLNTDDPTYYPAFAIFFYAVIITEIPSIVYRIELEKQKKWGQHPMFLFILFIMALVFTILSFYQPS